MKLHPSVGLSGAPAPDERLFDGQSSNPMVQVQDLCVHFGRSLALEGLSFELAAGESMALWGGNGAGKTTAIRAILGLLPFSGQVRLAGHSLPREGRHARAQLGYVPQQLAFYADMGSLALLDYFARLRRAPAGDPERLLARVGLADQARKPVGALSGGMKQRLALALALLGDPPILILDEPTASLDADARADFLSLLVEQRVAGKTLILTSHRLEEVAMLADRVIVLADGRPQFECPSHALERALHPESTLKVALDDPRIEAALAALAEAGFEARRNGHGLRVRVATGRRALPLATLLAAGIPVDDLSLEERTWSPE